MVRKLDLVGAIDIGKRLGCNPDQIFTWKGRYVDFPKPYAMVNTRTAIWLWSDIARWIKKTGRDETFPIPEKWVVGKP